MVLFFSLHNLCYNNKKNLRKPLMNAILLMKEMLLEILHMELKQLEYFLTISKLNSFTLAADQLYISQPGITSAIRRLEDELGIQLFVRNRKTAILTPEGQIFANHIESVMSDVTKALNKVEEMKNLTKCTITIGISPVSSVSSASFLLAKFKSLYPDLDLTLVEDCSTNLQKLLEDGKIDLAFLLLESEVDSFESLILGTQELVLGLPSFHLLKGKNKLPLSAVQKENFVLLKTGCPVRTVIEHRFSAQNLTPNISFETNYMQAIQRLVLCGAGITILPSEAFENNNNFSTVPLDPPLYVTTYIAYKKTRALSKATQTLYDFIKSSCTL